MNQNEYVLSSRRCGQNHVWKEESRVKSAPAIKKEVPRKNDGTRQYRNRLFNTLMFKSNVQIDQEHYRLKWCIQKVMNYRTESNRILSCHRSSHKDLSRYLWQEYRLPGGKLDFSKRCREVGVNIH